MNDGLISVLAGIVLSVVYIISSIWVIQIALRKEEWSSFIKLVLGGMTIRYFVTLGIVWLAITVFELKEFEFLLTVFLTIFVMIIVEILYLNKNATKFKLKK